MENLLQSVRNALLRYCCGNLTSRFCHLHSACPGRVSNSSPPDKDCCTLTKMASWKKHRTRNLRITKRFAFYMFEAKKCGTMAPPYFWSKMEMLYFLFQIIILVRLWGDTMLVPTGIVVGICFMILCSVLGNLLVVVSVLSVRRLRQPANLLLLSLALTGKASPIS